MATVKAEVKRPTTHCDLRAGPCSEGPDRRPDIRTANSRETWAFTLIELAERTWKTEPVKGFKEEHPNNEDLRWVQLGVWGKLGYEP
ncbi:MAG TPA: hypothetical protein PK373_07860 [Sedimentisphaerales bacterium]|nr:hypothetical protein [Sedimentisphaerales bacterium]HQG48988.1 hypothetical protein [Sedimentisphaerales bacterium]